MALNYIATCQPPTAVTSSVCCRFVSRDELNLVVARFSKLEIYRATRDGLEPVTQLNIFGKIINLASFRPKDYKKDLILMLTEKFDLSFLRFNRSSNTVITKAFGSVEDKLSRVDEGPPRLRIDPTGSYALIHIFNGLLKIVRLDLKGKSNLNIANVRLNELYITDIAFLTSPSSNSLHIAVVYNYGEGKSFRSYILRIQDSELRDGPYSVSGIQADISLIIPINTRDKIACLVGSRTFSLITVDSVLTETPSCFNGYETFLMYERINKSQTCTCIVGDSSGQLFLINVDTKPIVHLLGSVCLPVSITYIDNGVAFIGSCLGDSQLIRINKFKVDDSYITVMDNFLNIGPIVDMEVVDRYNQGVPQLVTCSGAHRWGTLRVLNNGVQIEELTSFSINRLKSIFSLQLNCGERGVHDTILLSFFHKSVIIRECACLLSVVETPCFISSESTLYAGNVIHSQVIQILKQQILLIRCKDLSLQHTYKPPIEGKISLCQCNGWNVALFIKSTLCLLEIRMGRIELLKTSEMNGSISCINMTCLSQPHGAGPADTIAICYWSKPEIEVYSLPDINLKCVDSPDNESVVVSILFVDFKPDVIYLIASMGVGHLYLYEYSHVKGELASRTKKHVGTFPSLLVPFRIKGSMIPQELVPGAEDVQDYPELGDLSVFGCSKRASIIYYSLMKIGFSYTDKQFVRFCCPYNSEGFELSFILITENKCTFCKISDISTYHVGTIQIYESPRKIAYQAETNTFGLITIHKNSATSRSYFSEFPLNKRPYCMRLPGLGMDKISTRQSEAAADLSFFYVLDPDNFEPVCGKNFARNEIAVSLCSCKLRDKDFSVFVVGTGVGEDKDSEPSVGRILVYQFCEKEIVEIASLRTHSGIYDIAEVKGRLVCCAGHIVMVLALRSDNDLMCIKSLSNNVTSLFCKTLDSTILIGDVVRSLAVYQANDDGQPLLVGTANEVNWATAIEIIDSKNYAYCDMKGHFSSAYCDERNYENDVPVIPPNTITTKKRFNLDQQVNVFKRGSLSYQVAQDVHVGNKHSLIFGTVSGMIGLMIDVPAPWSLFLRHLQTEILSKSHNVGGIPYEKWRSVPDRYCIPHNDVPIDGDIVESFLNLHPESMRAIIDSIPSYFAPDMTIEKKTDLITAYIGDLARLH